jgi:copper chaperone CopZ
MPGIAGIDIKAGNKDFTVEYDASKVKPDAIVAALVKAGEDKAKVKS